VPHEASPNREQPWHEVMQVCVLLNVVQERAYVCKGLTGLARTIFLTVNK